MRTAFWPYHAAMAWRIGRSGRPASEPTPTAEDILADLRDPLPSGPLVFGMPTRCPACDDYGYIDHIDLVDRIMKLHCPTCHSRWEITEQQIEAATAVAAAESDPS